MAAVSPVGFLHNVSTHTAQVDRLSSGAGLILPVSGAGSELRSRGGVRMPGDFQVTAQGTPNMSVSVASGLAYVPGPTAVAGTYTFANDAAYNVSIAASHATLIRRDLIVLRVADSFYAGSANQPDILAIPGTAGSGTDPALPPGYSYLVLARVTVRAGTTSILSTDITNLVTQAPIAGGVPVAVAGVSQNGSHVDQLRMNAGQLQRWTGGAWESVATDPRIYYDFITTTPVSGSGTATRIAEAKFTPQLQLSAGRSYRATIGGLMNADTTGIRHSVSVRAVAGTSTPINSSPLLATRQQVFTAAGTNGRVSTDLEGRFAVSATGTYTLSVWLEPTGGILALVVDARGRIDFRIEDMGPAPSNEYTPL